MLVEPPGNSQTAPRTPSPTHPTMEPSSSNTEAELERFREQWRQEVSERNRKPETRSAAPTKAPKQKETAPPTAASSRAKDVRDFSEDVEPRAYHDLPNKEEQLKLGTEGQNYDRDVNKEPKTALEHYERAVDKETTGQLGDSLRHYRTAFKVGSIRCRPPKHNAEVGRSSMMASTKPTSANTSLHLLSNLNPPTRTRPTQP